MNNQRRKAEQAPETERDREIKKKGAEALEDYIDRKTKEFLFGPEERPPPKGTPLSHRLRKPVKTEEERQREESKRLDEEATRRRFELWRKRADAWRELTDEQRDAAQKKIREKHEEINSRPGISKWD